MKRANSKRKNLPSIVNPFAPICLQWWVNLPSLAGLARVSSGLDPCALNGEFISLQWCVHLPSTCFFPAQAKLGTFDVHMAISNVSTRFIYVFVPPKKFLCADQSYRLYPVTAVPTSSVHFTHVFILVGLLSAQANLTSFTP